MMANVISWRLLTSFFRAFVGPFVVGFALLAAPAAEGALTHQWLFNDGTANDSVGAAHGTLNGNAVVTAGQLSLPNTATGGNATVDLNSGVIGINAYPAVTVAMWATPSSAMTGFTTALGFGQVNTTDPELAGNYFILQTHRGDNVSRAAIAISNDADPFTEEDFANGPELNDNLQHLYVAVLTNTSISLSVDKAPLVTAVVDGTNMISGLSNEFARIGSSYPVDPLFIGTVNQLNLYNHALTQTEINALAIVGPALPTLRINRDTGVIDFVNGQAPVNVVGYSITSAAGGLNSTAWLPIADNYDASSGGEFDNNDNWTKLSAAGSKTDFSEFELDGGNGGAWGAGATTSLQLGGNGAWRKSIYEDLLIEVRLDNGTDYPVSIEYVGNGGQPFRRSDLNFDGNINVTDWNLYLAKVGTTFSNMSAAETYAMGDLNGDLVNNRADFRLFKTDYNIANGAGSFEILLASVPEPSTLTMLVLACAGLLPRRLRGALVQPVEGHGSGRTSCGPQSYSRFALLAVAAAFVALVGQADAAVRNRYSFNEGVAASALGRTIIDSVSGKHGIVRGTAGTGEASATATELVLNGGASATAAYVDLPNGLVSGLNDGSFEAWYTMTSAQSWGRIFDFGSTDSAATMGELTAPGGGGSGQDFLFYAPARGTNLAQQRVGFGNQDLLFGGSQAGNAGAGIYTDLDPEFTHVLNQQYHAVVVIDADGGGPGIATQALYINGVLAPQLAGETQANPLPSAHQLANLNDVNNWLGRSNWTVDANFGGSFNEFRIYDHALSESEVTNDFILGPNAAPGATVVSLKVNTTNGQVTLVNNFNQPLQIDYYEVTSAAGALNTAGWTSIDGNTAPGVGWDKSGTSNANQLIELFLPEAGYTFPAMSEVSIGSAYNPAIFGTGNNGDLGFGIVLASGAFLSGNVQYITSAAVPGDYNNNGTVDAADYVLWRNGGPLQNDPTPGVQAADYTFWRGRFGSTSGAGAGSTAAVPEPFAWTFVACGLLGLAALRRRGRWSQPLVALLVGVVLAACSHAATPDRFYRFGDDSAENPILNQPPNSDFGAFTLDSAAVAGTDFQDLSPAGGGPLYVNTQSTGRPGAAAGEWGLGFDGVDDNLVRANGGLGSPAVGDDDPSYSGVGYTGITTRLIDGWVRPTNAALGRQDIVNDTAQFGIFISADDKWGFVNSTTTITSTANVSFNAWTHVMHRTYTNDAAALYVNGVVVAATGNNYNTTAAAGNIVFGASVNQSASFFQGQLDNFSIYVSGNNTGQASGRDYGEVNIATENEFIRQRLIGVQQGDVNLSGGAPNATDVAIFVANWLSVRQVNGVNVGGDLTSRMVGDFNLNGMVDIDDAYTLHAALSAAGAGGLDFSLLGSGVPEPTGLLLAVCGLAALVGRWRRPRYSIGKCV